MNSYDYLFKFILIGDSTVGKTCLLNTFVEGNFKTSSEPTIGVEFGSKLINCKNNTKVRLQIWDTAGQESFRSITRSYYRGAIGAILVYDLTNEDSFKAVPKWLTDCREHTNQNLSTILVGNKCDLESLRQINYEDAKEFSRDHNLLCIETSAKTGVGIDSIFQILSEQIVAKIDAGIINPENETGIKRGKGKKEEIEDSVDQNIALHLEEQIENRTNEKESCC